MADNEWHQLAIRAGAVFTPAAPINAERLFAGRLAQIRQVVDAVIQPGQHAIIFGERGVGKTSLANIISAKLASPDHNIIAPRVNCDTSDTYSSLWRKMFGQISLTSDIQGMGLNGKLTQETTTLAQEFNTKITPENVRYALAALSVNNLPILIIDEFDRVRDSGLRATLADTVKTLSDDSIGATIVLVGVADSVTELIQEHQSVARCLMQIQMPRMPTEELHEILDNGMQYLGMTMDAEAKSEIAALSLGLPTYTHLLGRNAARAAADGRSLVVTADHVKAATERAIQEAQQSIRTAYHRATTTVRGGTMFSQVLLACALAKTDELGYFAAGDIREPLKEITGRAYEIPSFAPHLYAFCRDERGRILQKTDIPYRNRYRFVDPLMQPYIVMQGRAKGLVRGPDTRQTLRLPNID